jgi:hypothetical protein
MRRLALSILLLSTAALLGGCDMLGIQSLEQLTAVRDADGRAIGGGCRQAGRGIEECFTMNRHADKAAVFAGWRDMNDYMRENHLEAAAPAVTAGDKPATVDSPDGASPQAAASQDAKVASEARVRPGKRRAAGAS